MAKNPKLPVLAAFGFIVHGLAAAPTEIEASRALNPYLITESANIFEDYNIRFGPLDFDLIGTFGVEYNDNINLSETDALDDIILKPGIELGTRWVINEDNEVTLSVGAQYWVYLLDNGDVNNSTNTLRLAPNTELSYRIRVGELVFRVFDNFRYDFEADEAFVQSPGNERPPTNQRLENRFGGQTSWNLWTEYECSAEIARVDVWSPDDNFSYINRTAYEGNVAVSRQFLSNLSFGVGASYYTETYEEPVNNDGDGLQVGIFSTWEIIEPVSLSGVLNWNELRFDNDGSINDPSDSLSTASGSLRLMHRINAVLRHEVEGYYRPERSDISNYITTTGAGYGIFWDITEPLTLRTQLRFEDAEISGGNATGTVKDDHTRTVFLIGFNYQLGPQVASSVGYSYTDRESDAVGRSYSANRIQANLTYDF